MHACERENASLRRARRPLRRPLRRRLSLQRAARCPAATYRLRDELRGLGRRTLGRVHGDLEEREDGISSTQGSGLWCIGLRALGLVRVREHLEEGGPALLLTSHMLTWKMLGQHLPVTKSRSPSSSCAMPLSTCSLEAARRWHGDGTEVARRDGREMGAARAAHLGSSSRRRSAALISPERSMKRCTAPLAGQITCLGFGLGLGSCRW